MKKEEKRMITAVVIDTDENTAKTVEFEDELDELYRLLKCDCFDIARRKIGGRWYDIYCDDIGRFKDDPICTAVNAFNPNDLLVGNLIIANHDSEGYTQSLTPDDTIRIYSHIGTYSDGDMKRVAVMITI